MDKKDKELEDEEISRYGEFITSYFAWLPIEKQKSKADEMNNMTDK